MRRRPLVRLTAAMLLARSCRSTDSSTLTLCSIEDAISRLHQTADTIKSGPEQLDTFDESLFEELVERIIAESQTCIRFRLWGGVELTEEVRRAKR